MYNLLNLKTFKFYFFLIEEPSFPGKVSTIKKIRHISSDNQVIYLVGEKNDLLASCDGYEWNNV